MDGSEKTRVAVFIDWQNAYKTAREAFGLYSMPNEHGNFSPFKLGLLLAVGNGRGPAGVDLVKVEIHRGLPSQRHDPIGYAANRRQAAAWVKERPSIVQPRLRPLRYPRNYPNEPVVEKGVDVQLAIAAVESVLTEAADVAVIFSHDTDLLPVPELIGRTIGPSHVETSSWEESSDFRQRLRPKAGIDHQYITEKMFRRIETPVNYAHPGRSSGSVRRSR